MFVIHLAVPSLFVIRVTAGQLVCVVAMNMTEMKTLIISCYE